MALHSSSKVILFRGSSSDEDSGAKDKYTELLQNDHESVESIPVLEHRYLLTPENTDQIVHARPGYSALIFTSKNAVKALAQAASQWIEQTSCETNDGDKAAREEAWTRFLQLPVFVVGKATASACRSLLYSSDRSADIRGQDTGKATAMLPQILEFCRDECERNKETGARLLFFCGNQRRDTLPDGIRQSGYTVELTELVSYTTAGRSLNQVEADLVAVLDKGKMQSDVARDKKQACSADHALVWFVCFSPSGVRVVAPIINALAEQETRILRPDTAAGCRKTNAKAAFCYRLVAIGETTFSELVMQGFCKELVVLADEPNAQGVRNAIHW